MNDSTIMLRALESGDTSDATVSAALDALLETGALSLLGAVREVVRTVDAGETAREVACACRTIEAGAPFRDQLCRECRSLANVPVEEGSTIFVNPGDAAPSAFRSPDPDSPSAWGEWYVYVGAKWLLDRNEQLTKQHNAAIRRRAARADFAPSAQKGGNKR